MGALAVLHVPHSSAAIPADLRSSYSVAEDALERELLTMTDWFTDELFALSSSVATTVRFPMSRLVLDPERYLDDDLEPMASRGMGVIYTRTSDGKVLRPPPSMRERAELIERYYVPYLAALSDAVGEAIAREGACLLVDCHSYPAQPIPCDMDQSLDRPNICLGTDRFHTPDWLRRRAVELFTSFGLSVEVDRPYAGVLVPEAYAGRDERVFAVMIEVNRRLYLDEGSGEKAGGFSAVT